MVITHHCQQANVANTPKFHRNCSVSDYLALVQIKIWWQKCYKAIILTHRGRDKWLPFWKLHFQIHFIEWKSYNFDWNFIEDCSQGPIDNMPALVLTMAWCQTGNHFVLASMRQWLVTGSLRSFYVTNVVMLTSIGQLGTNFIEILIKTTTILIQ